MTLELTANVPWSDREHATPLADVRRAQRECRFTAPLDYHSVAVARPEAWGWFLRNANCADLYGRRWQTLQTRWASHEHKLNHILTGDDLPEFSAPADPDAAPPEGEVWLYSRPGDPEPACVLKVG